MEVKVGLFKSPFAFRQGAQYNESITNRLPKA